MRLEKYLDEMCGKKHSKKKKNKGMDEALNLDSKQAELASKAIGGLFDSRRSKEWDTAMNVMFIKKSSLVSSALKKLMKVTGKPTFGAKSYLGVLMADLKDLEIMAEKLYWKWMDTQESYEKATDFRKNFKETGKDADAWTKKKTNEEFGEDRGNALAKKLVGEWKKIAGENIEVEYIKGAFFGFGSELATLRLFMKYSNKGKNNPSGKFDVGFSTNLKKHYFKMEV
jgi:hypothetical protein